MTSRHDCERISGLSSWHALMPGRNGLFARQRPIASADSRPADTCASGFWLSSALRSKAVVDSEKSKIMRATAAYPPIAEVRVAATRYSAVDPQRTLSWLAIIACNKHFSELIKSFICVIRNK
jgi:hypothetical protein